MIGGGPAGAAAARMLARWGHSTLLFARPAARGALAESLPPSCTKLLDTLGLRAAVDAAGFLRATGNTVCWGAERGRVELFAPGSCGYQVTRDRFDTVLISAARDDGAVVEREVVVRRVERDANEWTVTCDSTTGTQTVRARCVLDCSGRAGIVARDGWRRPSSGARTMAVVGVWEREDRWPALSDETHTVVESYAGGWAWSIPVSVRERYFTVMVDPDLTRLRGRRELSGVYAVELSQTRRLSALTQGARLCGEPWARDASPYTAERFGEVGLLLVGDAASFVDPLSSYGVKKAFASAWLAAIVTNTWLRHAAGGEAALDFFNERERAMYRHLQRQSAELGGAAAAAHASVFWGDRSDAEPALDGAIDVDGLRSDPRVLAAFEELKRRPSVQFRRATGVSVSPRPLVRGDQIVLEDHLITPGVNRGLRYARNIDLLLLTRVAERHDQVPDIFDAYNRSAPPASLPDFLGALSTLVGLEMLTVS